MGFFSFLKSSCLFLKWTEKGQSHRDKKGPTTHFQFFTTQFGTKFSNSLKPYSVELFF